MTLGGGGGVGYIEMGRTVAPPPAPCVGSSASLSLYGGPGTDYFSESVDLALPMVDGSRPCQTGTVTIDMPFNIGPQLSALSAALADLLYLGEGIGGRVFYAQWGLEVDGRASSYSSPYRRFWAWFEVDAYVSYYPWLGYGSLWEIQTLTHYHLEASGHVRYYLPDGTYVEEDLIPYREINTDEDTWAGATNWPSLDIGSTTFVLPGGQQTVYNVSWSSEIYGSTFYGVPPHRDFSEMFSSVSIESETGP